MKYPYFKYTFTRLVYNRINTPQFAWTKGTTYSVNILRNIKNYYITYIFNVLEEGVK